MRSFSLPVALVVLMASCGLFQSDKDASEEDEGKSAGTEKAVLAVAEAPRLDFGIVIVNSQKALSLTLRNEGGARAEGILGMLQGEGFGYLGGMWPGNDGTCGGSLEPDKECRLNLVFKASGSEFTDVWVSGKLNLVWNTKGEASSSNVSIELAAKARGSCQSERVLWEPKAVASDVLDALADHGQTFEVPADVRVATFSLPLARKEGTTLTSLRFHLTADCRAQPTAAPAPCVRTLASASLNLQALPVHTGGVPPIFDVRLPRAVTLESGKTYWWILDAEGLSQGGALYTGLAASGAQDAFAEGAAAKGVFNSRTGTPWAILDPSAGAETYTDRAFGLRACQQID